jgi:hypothetical protein
MATPPHDIENVYSTFLRTHVSPFRRQYRMDKPILIPSIITFLSSKTRESSSRREHKLLAFRYTRSSKYQVLTSALG